MRIIEAKGTFEDCGAQVGEASREDVHAVLAALQEHLTRTAGFRSFAEMHARALPHFRLAQVRCPEAVAWLRGMSRGADLALFHLIVTAFCEEIEETGAPEKCSTLVVPTRAGAMLGHNEDYPAFNLGRMHVLDLRVDGRPRVVGLSYPAQLPAIAGALNGHGIAISCNALNCPGDAGGVSNNLNHLQALFARDVNEAVRALTAGPFALGHHYTVLPASGAGVSIETAPRSACAYGWTLDPIGLRKAFGHTNHVLRLEPARRRKGSASSVARLARLRKASKRPPATPEGLLALLRNDTVVCRDGSDGGSVTLASIVIRPSTREILIQGRGPADGPAVRLTL